MQILHVLFSFQAQSLHLLGWRQLDQVLIDLCDLLLETMLLLAGVSLAGVFEHGR